MRDRISEFEKQEMMRVNVVIMLPFRDGDHSPCTLKSHRP